MNNKDIQFYHVIILHRAFKYDLTLYIKSNSIKFQPVSLY